MGINIDGIIPGSYPWTMGLCPSTDTILWSHITVDEHLDFAGAIKKLPKEELKFQK